MSAAGLAGVTVPEALILTVRVAAVGALQARAVQEQATSWMTTTMLVVEAVAVPQLASVVVIVRVSVTSSAM